MHILLEIAERHDDAARLLGTAIQAGADVYMEKPISVDVVEGHAMLAAARKHGRTVQVNMQRRSTPHLIEARDDIIRAGKLGRCERRDEASRSREEARARRLHPR